MKYVKYLSIGIVICGFFLFRPYHMQHTGLMYVGDDESYFAHASALAFFQFPSYEHEGNFIGTKSPMHSIGPGLLAAPFVLIFSQIDRIKGSPLIKERKGNNIRGSWSLFGFVVATFFYFCWGCFLLYFGVRYHVDDRTAFLAVLYMIVFRGFPLYVFRRPLFAPVYEFFLQSAVIYILLRDVKDRFLDQTNRNILFLIGLLTGLIILVRYNNIVIALCVPLVLFLMGRKKVACQQQWKKIIYVYCVAGALIFIFKIFPVLLYGEGYKNTISVLSNVYSPMIYVRRIAHIFFGIDWGLIFTAPFLVIGLIQMFCMKHSELKNKIMVFAAAMLVNLYIVIMWGTQGAWYGYRYVIFSLAPIVLFPFANFLTRAMHKYSYKNILLVVLVIALFPILSMLSFEGNSSNLTLRIIQDYIPNVGYGAAEWGNRTYQLEVWKTLIFHPQEYSIVLYKGGLVYSIYLFSLIFKLQRFIPPALLEKYTVFNVEVLIKTVIMYIIPLLMYCGIKKLKHKDIIKNA